MTTSQKVGSWILLFLLLCLLGGVVTVTMRVVKPNPCNDGGEHQWGKWGDLETGFNGDFQTRQCEKCGKAETSDVD